MELNKIFINGNLTADPELRYTSTGTAVCDLRLASNRRYKKGDSLEEETCFVNITAWGRQGETCNQYLKKGSPVLIEGRLQHQTWKDKESGGNRSKHVIVADRVHFMPKAGGENTGEGAPSEESADSLGSGPYPEQSFNDEVPF
ncbi:MAG TPA: single-stranded DNA-binding protein [Planctomycetes bacterium]|nr:single-stranded DNA-binding protein [Planctomycetota bacterium]HIN81116.1 single-stranded DNA-binding protein [Planctomycetota bacterium]